MPTGFSLLVTLQRRAASGAGLNGSLQITSPLHVGAVSRTITILFQEINEKWPDTPPGDANLRSYLTRRGFNQNAVEQVIKVFRSAMSLANVETGEHDSPEDEGMPNVTPDHPAGAKVMQQQQPTHGSIKPIIFDMETISGQYSFDNADDLEKFIQKLEQIRPLLPRKKTDGTDLG